MDSISTLNAIKAVMAGLPTGAPAADQIVLICNPDGTPVKKYPAQQLIQDMAKAGNGYGTCSTAATTAAKVVSIDNFILLKHGKVSILFNSAIDATSATLNVSSTGAKPIKFNGETLNPGVIKARTIVQFQYDGTNWNIVGILGLEQAQSPSDLFVDLGLPSGLKWALRNLDITQANKFAASEFQYECTFFSWGNTEGHNPANASSFSYDWGSNNEGPYAGTPGAKLTANMAPSQDAARANLGAPWRMPTTGEFAELFENVDFINADGTVIDPTQTNKLVTVNSIVGIYLKSKINEKRIFFPCSGYGYGQSWGHRGSGGGYWSASLSSQALGRGLVFSSGGVNPQNGSSRFYGFAVRPVQ